MDQAELVKEITKAVRDAVSPQIETAAKTAADTAVGAAVTAIDERVKAAEAKAAEAAKAVAAVAEKASKPADDGVLTRTVSGDVVLLSRGGAVRAFGGPAYVRDKALGDRPYSLANLVRAMLEKDESFAPLEVHVSNELRKVGFIGSGKGRAYMVPIAATEQYLPEAERGSQTVRALRSLLDDAMPIREDVEATHAALKAYRPDLLGKAMDPFDSTLGGTLIPYPERGQLIELLRKASVMGQAGCQQIGLPPQGLDYPKETGGTTFARYAPNQTINDSNVGTGSVKLSPKMLAGIVKLPNSLIRFSNPAVEAVVRRALAADAALAADLSYLEGGGGTLDVEGLLRYAQSVNDTPTRDKVTLHNAKTIGAAGNTFQPEDVALMISNIEEAPDPEGPTAWIMRPKLFYAIANRRADAITAGDAAGPFLFPVTRGAMSGAVEKVLMNIPVVTSTQVSNTRIKGGGTGLTYTICGNFRRAVIGRVGVIEIAVSTERGFELDQTWLRAVMWDDFALLTPESFCVSDQLVMG